ncbi:hypothetical protein AVEN_113022-1 [Araneus ventricosus]|uniref:Uncharacterized protein n=1 Tax=Araneus ventricosus TaxID=182803 RepID=A0A4Y2VG48_ARAVE|nr:hypothetical protein AVEN_113022-1 [Araneus ventricosus]
MNNVSAKDCSASAHQHSVPLSSAMKKRKEQVVGTAAALARWQNAARRFRSGGAVVVRSASSSRNAYAETAYLPRATCRTKIKNGDGTTNVRTARTNTATVAMNARTFIQHMSRHGQTATVKVYPVQPVR